MSFHMDADGAWSLTPAYDVTFARGHGFTSTHQMRVRDQVRDIRARDLLAVAEEFGVKRPERVLQQTRDAIGDWERFAARYDVPNDAVRAIRGELDERAEALGGGPAGR